jgi:hypothetical protein
MDSLQTGDRVKIVGSGIILEQDSCVAQGEVKVRIPVQEGGAVVFKTVHVPRCMVKPAE